jgi:DNA (cytosine-5)-methyltransferase 1
VRVYYNEFDPYCAQWLRNLMAEGLIPAGVVDDRDIRQVQPSDVREFDQCHFFAGLGGWAYAFHLARWEGPAWTGSCPCQPFSSAGKRRGFADERHLWPEWFRLIRECRPAVLFGEQVASAIGGGWLDAVFADLEGQGYACGAADLCAASVKAKHPRQRLFFVAYSGGAGLAGPVTYREGIRRSERASPTKHCHAGLRARVCFEPNPGALVRVDGLPRPVGQVRALGNAIVPQVAAEFIIAAREVVN